MKFSHRIDKFPCVPVRYRAALPIALAASLDYLSLNDPAFRPFPMTHAPQNPQHQPAALLMAWAGLALMLAASLVLWLRYGPVVFLDGLAMAWSCF